LTRDPDGSVLDVNTLAILTELKVGIMDRACFLLHHRGAFETNVGTLVLPEKQSSTVIGEVLTRPALDRARSDDRAPGARQTIVDFSRRIQIMQKFRSYAFEGIMSQTTAVEFQRKFGEFQHQAQREPVEITRHGRRELVLMSADHYDWLMSAARHSHRTADASSVVVDAVRRAQMDPEHAALDDLLK
jgi:prevent-host-death family protein